jgi:Flp pilus assembly protein TadG
MKMNTNWFRRMKNNQGAAAIEFAFILPVLILMLFGIIEFSVLLYDKAMITNASREGARAGMVYSFPTPVPDTEIRNVVNNYCATNLITFGPAATPTTTIAKTVETFGDAIRVRVTYPYNFLVLPNFVAGLVGGSTVSAETVMRMEG